VPTRIDSEVPPLLFDGAAIPNEDSGDVPGPGHLLAEEPVEPTSRIEDIQLSLKFIQLLKTARLENSGLDPDDLERLRNPTPAPIEILEDPDFRLSLDLFLAHTDASQASYTASHNAILRRHPDDEILSYDQIKRRIKQISGVVPLLHDMCPNTCVAYTGPFEELDKCPVCSEPRYEPAAAERAERVPRQQFSTIPIGPQLQALWSRDKSADAMRYRETHTASILNKLRESNGHIPIYDDFTCGSEYLKAVSDNQIESGDTVLLFSIDGAQLYRNKSSDCSIYIWIILNLAPDKRYKKKHVLPGGFIPGPNHPKNLNSFIFPGLYHLSAIQHEGLMIWDGFRQVRSSSQLFLAFATADAVGMADLNGWVGHHGKYGCRFVCGMPGCHKPGVPHYYPAMLKPTNFNVEGCDHDDIDVNNLPSASTTEYRRKLRTVIESHNQTQYAVRQREAGLCGPSIFDGIHRILPLPGCFPADSMHLTAINDPELLLGLWRGIFKCGGTDNRAHWDWAVLTGDTWKAHGKLVADAAPYLPGSFDRTPRNPAEKISSGYKASEYVVYLYGLGPGLFYGVLPDKYWRNFCRLVCGVRLMLQRSISASDLVTAHEALLSFCIEFEQIYCQRRVDRLHFVRQSVHALTHLAHETIRVGPLALLAQWVMERTIGNLGQEIRQHSNPYANLAQRGLLRSQINALKAMIPDLELESPPLPYGSIDLGDGYVLLRKRDSTAQEVRRCEANAIRSYLSDAGSDVPQDWAPTVTRWAQLRLPNGQTARSLWNEHEKKKTPRRARNVKVFIPIIFPRSTLTFRLSLSQVDHAEHGSICRSSVLLSHQSFGCPEASCSCFVIWSTRRSTTSSFV
jgi:hypothetical protein